MKMQEKKIEEMEIEKSLLESRFNTLEGKVDEMFKKLENKLSIKIVENNSKHLSEDKNKRNGKKNLCS